MASWGLEDDENMTPKIDKPKILKQRQTMKIEERAWKQSVELNNQKFFHQGNRNEHEWNLIPVKWQVTEHIHVNKNGKIHIALKFYFNNNNV